MRNLVAGILQEVAASALWSAITWILPWLAAVGAWWAADAGGAIGGVLDLFHAYPAPVALVAILIFLAGVFTGVLVCVSAMRAVAREDSKSEAEERSVIAFLKCPAEVRRVASRAYREKSVLVPDDQWHTVGRMNGYFWGSPQDVGVDVYITDGLRELLDAHPELLEPEQPKTDGGLRPIGIPRV